MAFKSNSSRSEEAVFSTANLRVALKASSAAYKKNGRLMQEVGNNLICISFAEPLDGSDFKLADTKFGECGISNKYFESMVDGSARKKKPVLVFKMAQDKFLHIWDNHLQQQVAGALTAGKTVLFTGHSIGGALATLATLAILENFGKSTAVFCITFGFPLIGDENLARAVRRQGWANRFCHVVSRGDIFSRILLAPCTTVSMPLDTLLPYWHKAMEQMNNDDTDSIMEDAHSENLDFSTKFIRTVLQHACAVVNYTSATNMDPTNKLIASLKPAVKLSPYRPFGYYVLLSDKGALWVENYEAVLPILYYSLVTAQPSLSVSEHVEYGRVFQPITNMVKLEGLSNLSLSQAALSSAMDAQLDDLGLGFQNTPARLALRAAGELENKLKENLEKVKEEVEKLTDGYMKKQMGEVDKLVGGHMKKLREYRNRCLKQSGNNGYYDTFREHKTEEDFKANLDRLNLAGFYDRLEDMVENHQLPDDFQCDEEWIRRGTEYRLLVEPLDIANYYRLGKHEDSGHYIVSARPRRYKALEKWLADKETKDNNQGAQMVYDLQRDSCFWAHVEEITWFMNNPKEKPEVVRAKCEEFQSYVKGLMDRNELCVDEVVMGESSFVKCWKKLSQLQDTRASPLYPLFMHIN